MNLLSIDMYNYMMYEVLSLVYNIHPYLIKQEHVDETNIIMHNRWDILRKMSESDAVDIEREERRSMYPAQMKHESIKVRRGATIRFGGWNMARRLRTTSLEADTICKQLGMNIIGMFETGQVR